MKHIMSFLGILTKRRDHNSSINIVEIKDKAEVMKAGFPWTFSKESKLLLEPSVAREAILNLTHKRKVRNRKRLDYTWNIGQCLTCPVLFYTRRETRGAKQDLAFVTAGGINYILILHRSI